jgi:isopentenyldiphosphate isomerase
MLQKHKYNEEVVTIVDRDNNVIGSVPRPEMSSKGLIHRTSYILVKSPKGEYYVQKRAMHKRYCPGSWDVWFGGVLQKGSGYVNRRREL